jgi:pimeloyl-ACP methyl ester carboxylesterase
MDQRFIRIVWGEKDQWIPISRGEQLARALKTSELLRVPDAGHLIQEDAPESIVAALGSA